MASKLTPIMAMAGLYQNFHVNPSRKSGTLKILNDKYGLKVDEDEASDDWCVFVAESGDLVPWKSTPDSVQTVVNSFIEDWKQVSGEKGSIDNLKEGDLSGEEEKPAVEPENTPDDQIEKARIERDENIRKLAELEKLEQAEAELEERKAQEMEKREKRKEQSVPKAPEVKPSSLLDMIYEYVDNDVLEVFGDTGSGKTAFVKKVAYEAAEAGKKVFYLDTERNLTKKDRELLKKCKYQYTPVIDEIDKIVQNLPAGDVVILDSVGFPVLTTFARMSMKQKGDALLKLIAIFGSLKEWAYKNNGIVLVTNQPESEFNKAPNHVLRPFGDKSQFAAKEIWETIKESSNPGLTKSTIKAFRSRSVGHGKPIAQMKINDSGVEVVEA